jgi:hypothetical protein
MPRWMRYGVVLLLWYALLCFGQLATAHRSSNGNMADPVALFRMLSSNWLLLHFASLAVALGSPARTSRRLAA